MGWPHLAWEALNGALEDLEAGFMWSGLAWGGLGWASLKGSSWSPGGTWRLDVKVFKRAVVIRIDFLKAWAGHVWPWLA